MRTLLALVCLNLLACNDMPAPVDADGRDSGARADAGETGGVDSGPGGVDSGPGGVDSGPPTGCVYPANPVEPMAVGSVLWPYAWPEAIDGTGTNFPIDLEQVTCNTDPNIDWSPFDVLVFIAIPAW